MTVIRRHNRCPSLNAVTHVDTSFFRGRMLSKNSPSDVLWLISFSWENMEHHPETEEQICHYKAYHWPSFKEGTKHRNVQWHGLATVWKWGWRWKQTGKPQPASWAWQTPCSRMYAGSRMNELPIRHLAAQSSRQPHLLIPLPQPETAEAPEKQVSHHVSESRRLSCTSSFYWWRRFPRHNKTLAAAEPA